MFTIDAFVRHPKTIVTTILKTKLYIPRPGPNQLPRPHLIAQLEHGLHARLTLISAPAGYGKTTLLSEWIEGSPSRFAWISLDAGDNDPTRFLVYLISSIQGIQEGFGAALMASFQNAQSLAEEAILTGLINEVLSIHDSFVIVLDDYHLIENPQIDEMLTYLLDNLPENMHLVIASRSDPALPIVRLRARGQLSELRVSDLRFSLPEVGEILNEMLGFNLTPSELDVLARRTEGWAVGLQLASLSMQGRDDIQAFIQEFTGSHHFIVEYLTEEILGNQPEDLQRFLLHTSVLDRLTAPLCDTVTGNTGSQALLRQMYRQNLFLIPLDDAHEWYRYHQLFADLLHARLVQTTTPIELNELHRRASQWYASNDAPEDAIRHAIAAQDYEFAARIIEDSARSLLAQGQLVTLLRWIEALPSEFLESRLQLQVHHAWALFLSGQSAQSLQMLLDAYAAAQASPSSSEVNALLGEIATMLATIASLGHEPEKVIALAERALDHLPESDLVSRARAYRALGGAYGNQGDMERFTRVSEQARDLALQAENPFLAASIMELLAAAQTTRGRLRQAAQTYQELIDLSGVRASTTFPPAGVGFTGLAGIYLEWNDLETAQSYLDEGVRTSQRGGIGYNLVHVYCTQARLLNALGKSDNAQEALQLAERVYVRDRSLPAGVILSAHQVRHWLDRGELGIAHRWARGEIVSGEQVFEADNLPVILDELRLVSLAHVYLAEGRLEEVLSLAKGVCHQALVGDRLARVIEMRLLEALALHALGKAPEAITALAASLLLAEPGGYKRLYLEMGSSAYHLLETLYRDPFLDTILRDYLARILEAFTFGDRHAQPLVEPLTGRELEVLNLISQGFTNHQIAAQLVITLHTVKKHTSNIYGKLGVSSRTQAVARGQELRLL